MDRQSLDNTGASVTALEPTLIPSPMIPQQLNTAISEKDFLAASNNIEEWVSQRGFDDTTRHAIGIVSKLVDDELIREREFWDFDPRDYVSELPLPLRPRSAGAAAVFEAFENDLNAVLSSGPLIHPTAAPHTLTAAAEKMKELQMLDGETTKPESWLQEHQSANLEGAKKRKCNEPHTYQDAKKHRPNGHDLGSGSSESLASATSEVQTSQSHPHLRLCQTSPQSQFQSLCKGEEPPSRCTSRTTTPGSALAASPESNSATGNSPAMSTIQGDRTDTQEATTPASNETLPAKYNTIALPRTFEMYTNDELQQLAARIRRLINVCKDDRDEAGAAMEEKKRAGKTHCPEERELRRLLQDKCRLHEKKFERVKAELEKRGQMITGDTETRLY